MGVMPPGVKTVTDEEILSFMRESPDPAFTAGEIAEAVGMSPEGVSNRLADLEQRGEVYRKKPGRRTVIWWAECDHPDPACSA